MINKNVVLIADRVADFDSISIENKNLECIPPAYFDQIFNGLAQVSPKVTHYNSPQEFCTNMSSHKKDIVLSVWSGIGGKFRKGLVPSICEANNICYVGADPYVHIVCQDKYLTKNIASLFGIKSANDVLYISTTSPKYSTITSKDLI